MEANNKNITRVNNNELGLKKQIANRGLSLIGELDLLGQSTNSIVQLCDPKEYKPYSYDINSSHTKILAGCKDGTMIYWDIVNGTEIFLGKAHKLKIRSISISPNERFALSTGDDQQIILWNLETMNQELVFSSGGQNIQKIIFSEDNRYAITGSLFGLIQLWDLESGKEFNRFGYPTFPNDDCAFIGMSLFDNGNLLVACGDFTGVSIWSMPDGRYIGVCDDCHDNLVWNARFANNTKLLATCSRDHKIGFWDISKGKLLDWLYGHSSDVIDISFPNSGRFFLSGGLDKRVCLWDLKSLKQINAYDGFPNGVSRVFFHNDDKSALVCLFDEGVYRWKFSD